ncbi:uncharacterized protein IL334_004631 [Kwoniella shivajii]|uniref:Structural maintenance of chromosomes protein 5 n=1 Tax=Kwoniella shivajii TaxID=564305 RepID=A0ABZ1D0W2_9TREE|nr:hypothetical protein IL334_004631 [Kwoniella shivajii]
MPFASSSRKRPQAIDSSEDEEDPRPNLSVSPNKKRKQVIQDFQGKGGDSDLDDLNSDADGVLVGDEADDIAVDGDGNEVEGEVVRGQVSFRPEYERGDDGYVTGSVTGMKMTNFMTYDHVEFRPGPHLNMILGPNGTGKSSIAAAIAIGLGFPPKVMGRANELKAYVKQGADEAQVEIELKGKRGKRNTKIWRKFNREDEKSEWKLNGSTCTRKEVLECVQRFGIQANNLCSFLPQDKVAEFAKMAPEVVLKETMRAAGDPRLTQWHETLVEKGVNSKDLSITLEGHVNQRDRLQIQVDGLAPDVEHVQEREAREKEAEIMQHIVSVVQHNRIREEVTAALKERDQWKAKVTKLSNRRQPLKELKEHWDKKAYKAEIRLQTVEGKYKDGMKELRNKMNSARDVADRSAQVNDKLDMLRMVFQRREDDKRSTLEKIQKCQEILEEPREEVDSEMKVKGREKAALQTKYREKGHQLEEVKDEYEDNKKMFNELNHELDELTRRQTMLENIEIQKENAARDLEPSIGFLLDWLKVNGHTLESEVHKPPMISVSVPNRTYAWQVEQNTSRQHRSTFICTSQADFDRLLELNGTQYPPRIRSDGRRVDGGKVSLFLAYQEVSDATVNPRRPCDAETLRDLGMDGYAIDFVEAAPAVIAYLCAKARLHLTALTQKTSMEIDSKRLTSLGIASWATKDANTNAIQSSYGRREFVERTNPPQPAKAFNLAVDRDAVKRIVDEIAKKKKTKMDREAPHSALKDKMDEIENEREGIRRAGGEVEKRIKDLQEKLRRYQKAATDIESFRERLRKIEAQPSQEEERSKLKAEKLKYAKARLRPLDSCLTSCDDIISHCSDLMTANCAFLQGSVNKQAISERLNQGNEVLNEAHREYTAAAGRHTDAKARSANKWTQMTAAISSAPQEIKEEVRNRARVVEDLPSLEEAQNSLQTLRAQLELAVNIPGNVVGRYNDLKDRLELAQGVVDKEESELNGLKRDIKKTLDMFDPALETLVQAVSAKFSAAFARVKCTGEVRIRRVEGDFAAWGIEILVSYRDEDNLAILTGSHQSGGERSLATVTYLMSLSEMSRTPFSLVDEINQGMDQRAERAVHNQLVEVTCDADAGQYFLITPKLLTGLTYHPKMKVLIINNGTWLPDSRQATKRYGDLSACLKTYSKNHSIPAN